MISSLLNVIFLEVSKNNGFEGTWIDNSFQMFIIKPFPVFL